MTTNPLSERDLDRILHQNNRRTATADRRSTGGPDMEPDWMVQDRMDAALLMGGAGALGAVLSAILNPWLIALLFGWCSLSFVAWTVCRDPR